MTHEHDPVPTHARTGPRPVTLTFTHVDAGWLEATLATARHRVALRTSYLSDGPADLLRAVLALCRGATQARCSWTLEPGEHRWVFERYGARVRVLVLGFRDGLPLRADQPDCDGVIQLAAVVPLHELADALITAYDRARRLAWSTWEDAWSFPFPHDLLTLLWLWLRSTDRDGSARQ